MSLFNELRNSLPESERAIFDRVMGPSPETQAAARALGRMRANAAIVRVDLPLEQAFFVCTCLSKHLRGGNLPGPLAEGLRSAQTALERALRNDPDAAVCIDEILRASGCRNAAAELVQPSAQGS